MSTDKLKTLKRTPNNAEYQRHGANPLKHISGLGLPLALIFGFVLLLAILFGERLLPAREVDIVNVVTIHDTGSESLPPYKSAIRPTLSTADDPFEAPIRFQASGWLEPDPLPVKVTALVSGVVSQVFALEGELIRQGQLIATLIDDDTQLDLATANAALDSSRAAHAANRATMQQTHATIAALQKRVDAASAMLTYRREAAERFASAGSEAVKELEIIEARQMAIAQEAELAAMQAEITGEQARLQALEARQDQLAAAINLAETELARRKLALERTQIRSPVDGRIMRLLAKPGQQRMLGPDNPDSAAIAYLYEPGRLQARIDVPLAEAAQLHLGQAVKLRTNFLQDTVLTGTVTRINGEADLQRNTLQAKVRIHNPSDALRPEMLCRAEFLAATVESPTDQQGTNQYALQTVPQTPHDSSAQQTPALSSPGRVRLYVPDNALLERSGSEATVWLIDSSGERVKQQKVLLGNDPRGDFVRVLKGLLPGDRLVANPPEDLKPGVRVTAPVKNSK